MVISLTLKLPGSRVGTIKTCIVQLHLQHAGEEQKEAISDAATNNTASYEG